MEAFSASEEDDENSDFGRLRALASPKMLMGDRGEKGVIGLEDSSKTARFCSVFLCGTRQKRKYN